MFIHLNKLTPLQLAGTRVKVRRAKDWTKITSYQHGRRQWK